MLMRGYLSSYLSSDASHDVSATVRPSIAGRSVVRRSVVRRSIVGRSSVGLAIAGMAMVASLWPVAEARAAAAAADDPPVVMASGTLQQCLGITPGSATFSRTSGNAAACRQLPGADLYDQAGARYKAGDAAGAARLLTSAAQAGNPIAQLRLAMLYEQGQGVPRDKHAAMSWYARAAAQGEPASQHELGGYYEEADGVAENWDLACRLYRASATQGWMAGQFALGRCYEFGMSVPQDRQQAIAWFRKAGAQGHAQGTYYARWLADPSNNIGFRSDAEHNLVIGGQLRFALGSADPAGIAFHRSADRITWLKGLAAQVNASEAAARWQMQRDAFDACMRKSADGCHDPGARPR
jgi:TPR repeat protein